MFADHPCVLLKARLGKGWKDPNSAPFFVGIETIKRCEPLVWTVECAPGLQMFNEALLSAGCSAAAVFINVSILRWRA